MKEEIKEYEISKFKKKSIIEKRMVEINIEMKEQFEKLEEVKMRELQKTFKIYQKIIKELLEENKKKENKIESLIHENTALKREKNKDKEAFEKFRGSSLFLEENDSSRNILMQNNAFGFTKKNFFHKPAMKITHEEVEHEKIVPLKSPHLEKDNPNNTKKTATHEMNLRKIPRKSIFLENQMEFNFESDSLDVFNINFFLKNNITTLSLDDFEIRKDKGNNTLFSKFVFEKIDLFLYCDKESFQYENNAYSWNMYVTAGMDWKYGETFLELGLKNQNS